MSLTENLSGDNTNQGDYLKRAHDAETNGFKEDITDLANKAWNDTTYQGRASFKPSKKLNDKINEMLGHPIEEVFITASDVRHIKKHHLEHEDARGQVNISTGNLADIYDTLNDFDEATLAASPLSSAVVDSFARHVTLDRTLRRYPADYLVGHASFAFGLEFDASVRILDSQGYIYRMFNREFSDEDTRRQFHEMETGLRAWIDERLER